MATQKQIHSWLYSSRREAEMKAWDHLHLRVQELYCHPPKLDSRYPKITNTSIRDQLEQSTTHLCCWLARVETKFKCHMQSID
jgi:hypothetical protein